MNCPQCGDKAWASSGNYQPVFYCSKCKRNWTGWQQAIIEEQKSLLEEIEEVMIARGIRLDILEKKLALAKRRFESIKRVAEGCDSLVFKFKAEDAISELEG